MYACAEILTETYMHTCTDICIDIRVCMCMYRSVYGRRCRCVGRYVAGMSQWAHRDVRGRMCVCTVGCSQVFVGVNHSDCICVDTHV